jgi:phenylalanyl-tRNA synthetase beta chain
MQLSLSWLSDYINLPESVHELESVLTQVGLEVEFIENKAEQLKNIVVGEVLACEAHPKADKLTICTVTDGEQRETVVCGAPNVAEGQKVIFARIGAVIPSGGFVIDKRALRGVESHGMICSTAELELDDNHDGIAVLDDSAVPGTPIAVQLGLDDIIIGIGITPNRGDALSHIGVARDIAAVTRQQLRLPRPDVPAITNAAAFEIHIEDANLCPRYSAALITGIRVADSPPWLAARLRAAGVRPINNIVDITNFVMMEMGQPMHAFDREMLAGAEIRVRTSHAGECISTLDDMQRSLPEGVLLICDADKPVAIAGVMGGSDTAVQHRTTDVFLESACFNASSVRRTSRQLGLSTDSSYRFERGSDVDATVRALHRAVRMILDIAGGSYRGVYDKYPVEIAATAIPLRPARVDAILGTPIPADEQAAILRALQFDVSRLDDGTFICTVPTFRSDITREIDLIEEIARIHGYDNIPVPDRISINTGNRFDDLKYVERIRQLWLGFGFDEILSSSLVPLGHAALAGGEPITVLNPVSKERPALRGSLLSSLLEAVDHNIRNGNATLRMFEIGRVYSRNDDATSERNMLACILTGLAEERNWYAAARNFDFFDLKGAIQSFFDSMHLDNDAIFYYDRSSTLSTEALSVDVKGRFIGQATVLSEDIRRIFGIEQPIMYAEFDLDMLRQVQSNERTYVPVAKFPSVIRDLAIIVDEALPVVDIERSIAASGSVFLKKFRIVDVFTHESLGSGRKSVAVTMTFRADDRTLNDDEIQQGVRVVFDALRHDHQAELRV